MRQDFMGYDSWRARFMLTCYCSRMDAAFDSALLMPLVKRRSQYDLESP